MPDAEQERPAAVPTSVSAMVWTAARSAAFEAARLETVVLVREMDDGLRVRDADADAVQVVEVPAAYAGALRLEGRDGRVGPGQSGDLVADDTTAAPGCEST